MATITATPGIKTAFSGGVDDIVCEFSPAARKGVQVEVEGFTLDACTVTVFGISSDDGDVVAATGTPHIATLGDDKAAIGRASISALAGGSYNVTFIAL